MYPKMELYSYIFLEAFWTTMNCKLKSTKPLKSSFLLRNFSLNAQEVTYLETVKVFENLYESSSKSSLILTEIDYKAMRACFKDIPKVIDQYIALDPWGVCTYFDNFALQLIDNTMPLLIQAGIPQHFYSYLLEFELHALPLSPKAPRVFKFSDLEFGFVVWLIACGISTLAFSCEILWKVVKVKGKKVIGNAVGLFFLMRRIKIGF